MKHTLLLAMMFSGSLLAATHSHGPNTYGGEDNLNSWSILPETSVPIMINHEGKDTRYYIEVNNKRVSNVFILTNNESLEIDVPVTLKKEHGAQHFNVCSVAFHGNVGTRFCTKAELFLIEGI